MYVSVWVSDHVASKQSQAQQPNPRFRRAFPAIPTYEIPPKRTFFGVRTGLNGAGRLLAPMSLRARGGSGTYVTRMTQRLQLSDQLYGEHQETPAMIAVFLPSIHRLTCFLRVPKYAQ